FARSSLRKRFADCGNPRGTHHLISRKLLEDCRTSAGWLNDPTDRTKPGLRSFRNDLRSPYKDKRERLGFSCVRDILPCARLHHPGGRMLNLPGATRQDGGTGCTSSSSKRIHVWASVSMCSCWE